MSKDEFINWVLRRRNNSRKDASNSQDECESAYFSGMAKFADDCYKLLTRGRY